MRLGIGLLLAGLLGAAAPSAAQEVALDPPSLSGSDLEAKTKELIKARWQVDESSLVVEWGAYSGGEPDLDGGVSLMGIGSGGYWVIRFELKSGGLASVRARAGLLTPRLVASRRLHRGETLTAADIAVSTSVVWGAPRPPSLAPSEGWIVHRVITPGEPLRVPAVRPPMAVVSGNAVELIWDRGGVGLRLPGTAAGSAVLGDMVYVRTASGTRLRGVAVAPGIVNVTLGGNR